MNEMDKYRGEIDRIDKEMAKLFELRMECASKIADYKKAYGLPVLDSSREKLLVAKNLAYIEKNELKPFYEEFIYRTMDVSKKYQHSRISGVRVAYSGIEGSFASMAAARVFPDARRVPYQNFADAYKAVEAGECEAAILPIENSYAGEVGQVVDLMYAGSLSINGVYELPVSQCLLGTKESSLETIKVVQSHPQALAQCAEYIKKHGFAMDSVENTARAAKAVAERNDASLGAIASIETAELYGLKVIETNINESLQNVTKFAVFSKQHDVMKAADEYSTFILMFTVKNDAGTLAKAISVLGKYGYSMRVIRSRPLKDVNWQYYFYTEVEGKLSSETGTAMLNELEGQCEMFKVIGTYKPGMRL